MSGEVSMLRKKHCQELTPVCRFFKGLIKLDGVAASLGLKPRKHSFALEVKSLASTDHDNVTSDDVSQCKTIINDLQFSKTTIQHAMDRWCSRVLGANLLIIVLTGFLLAFTVGGFSYAYFGNMRELFLVVFFERPVLFGLLLGLLVMGVIILHFSMRRYIANNIELELAAVESRYDLAKAFHKNTRVWHSVFRPSPIGWTIFRAKTVNEIEQSLPDLVQG